MGSNKTQNNRNSLNVAVCLVTYNQEKYIKQAIDSVLKQKTTFPVDIIVGNDASVDGTADMVQSVVNQCVSPIGGGKIIVFNREKNMGIVGNTIDIFRYIFAHDYTYVAMLDGDDWWCDENKLQMQVDLMEKNADVSFCYMNGTSDKNLALNQKTTNRTCIKDMFNEIRSTGIANGTILHRVSMLRQIPLDKIEKQNLLSMDYPTNVYMARQGKVAFIDSISLYWRRTGNTTSSAASKEKAYRYIDHEVRQGLFLASEFPNTSYDFSKQEAEKFRCWQMYMWSYYQKDYESIVEAMSYDNFPRNWLNSRSEKNFLKNKMTFYTYVYFIKKIYTVLNILKRKINT